MSDHQEKLFLMWPLFLLILISGIAISYLVGKDAEMDKEDIATAKERLEVICREFPAGAICLKKKIGEEP